MDSCDFSPASYSFDDEAGDTKLDKFDMSVKHDVEVGMIPMIQAAQKLFEARGEKLALYASPWSPPAWMKLPVGGKQNMTLSATPNCLMPSMQRTWAKYFSKFIEAYRKQGINMWGVTVQNEPEAAVGWEACLYTPQFMATFVRDHLGPVLEEEQPGVKIVGFDHNKDHVLMWAKELADKEAAKYFAGVGVHWYGGLNTHNLNDTHNLDPSKMILATEACNCGGAVYENAAYAEGVVTKGVGPPNGNKNFQVPWWSRAEALGLDILEDLRFGCRADGLEPRPLHIWRAQPPQESVRRQHHHRPRGDHGPRQADHAGLVLLHGPLLALHSAGQQAHPPEEPRRDAGAAARAGRRQEWTGALFAPCDGNDVQKWSMDSDGSLIIPGTNEAKASEGFEHGGECIDHDQTSYIPGKLQTYACAHSPNQQWAVRSVPGGSNISASRAACASQPSPPRARPSDWTRAPR